MRQIVRYCIHFGQLAILVAIFIFTVGASFYNYSLLEQIAIIRAYEQVGMLSKFISVRHEGVVYEAKQFLETISMLPAFKDIGGGSECDQLSAKYMQDREEYANIGVISPTGEVICSGIVTQGSYNVAYRPYIQQALETDESAVSDYQIGAISNIPVFTVAYPIKDTNGITKNLAFVSVSLSWLRSFYSKVPLPAGVTLFLIDRNGILLDYLPATSGMTIGKKVTDVPLIRSILEKKEGTMRQVGLDGNMGLYAFTKARGISEGNAYVIVGIDEKKVDDELRGVFLKNMLIIIPMALLACIGIATVGHRFFHMARVSDTKVISGKK